MVRELERASVPEEIRLVRQYQAQGLISVRSTYNIAGLATREYGVINAAGTGVEYISPEAFMIRINAGQRQAAANAATEQQRANLVRRLNRPANTDLNTLPVEEREVLGMTAQQYRAFCTERGGTANPAEFRYRCLNGVWGNLRPNQPQPFL